MIIQYIKALHIIFVVTWFAGLFYIVRLFIYHVEADKKPEPERSILQGQFKIMEKRLWYIITVPSMYLAIIFGLWLVHEFNYWTKPFMLVKFSLVLLLVLYHLTCGKILRELQNDIIKNRSFSLRLWNEAATILLVSIVFVIVLKNALSWIWGLAGFFVFGLILFLATRMYKKSREKKGD